MKSVSFKIGLQSESPCIGNQTTQQKHLPLDIMMSQKQKKKRKRKKEQKHLCCFGVFS